MPTFIDRHLPGERGTMAKALGQAGLITLRFYPTVVSYRARDHWRSLTGRDFDREASLRARGDPQGPQQTELYCAEGKQLQNANGQSFVDLDVTGVRHGRLAVMMCNYLRINPACRGAKFDVQVDGVTVLSQSLNRRELGERRVFLGRHLQLGKEAGEITIAFSGFPKQESCPPRLAFVMKYSRDRMAEHPNRDPFAAKRLIWGGREMMREKSLTEQPPPYGALKKHDRSPIAPSRSSSHGEAKRSKRPYESSSDRCDLDAERDRHHDYRDKRSRREDDPGDRQWFRTWGKPANEPESDAEIRRAIELAFTPPESSDGHKPSEKTAESSSTRRNSISSSDRAGPVSKNLPVAADLRRPSDPRKRAYSAVSTLSDGFDVQDPTKLRQSEKGSKQASTPCQDHAKTAEVDKTVASHQVNTVPPTAAEPAPAGTPKDLKDLQSRNSALETEMMHLRLLCENRRLQRAVEMLRQELESGKTSTPFQPSDSTPQASEAAITPLQLPTSASADKEEERKVKPIPPTPPLSADCGSSVVTSEPALDGLTDASTASASQSPMTSFGSSYGASSTAALDCNLMRIGTHLEQPFEGARKEYFSAPASKTAFTVPTP